MDKPVVGRIVQLSQREIDRPYWDAACRQLLEKMDAEIMSKQPKPTVETLGPDDPKNPLNVVVVQHAEPYVALVPYAAQTFEQKDPQFAKQLVDAARYFEGLMLKKRRRR